MPRPPGRRRSRASAISSAMFPGFDAPAVQDPELASGAAGHVVEARPDRRDRGVGILGRGVAAGADRPDRFVGDHAASAIVVGRTPANAAATWPRPWRRCSPASRSSRVSPTQRIGVMPAPRTARSFLATISSVSPNSSRRSEWPTITYFTLSFASIGALTSPVNAPSVSQWQFCAPSAIGMLVAVDRRLHRTQRGERRAHDDVDARRSPCCRAGTTSFCTTWIASKWSWCIFQLPAIIGLRSVIFSALCVLRRSASQPGQVAPLDSSSAAPPPVDTWSMSSARPNWRDRGRAVAAADDGEAAAVRDRLGDGRACRPRTARARTRPSVRSTARSRRARSRRRTCRRSRGRCRGPSNRPGSTPRHDVPHLGVRASISCAITTSVGSRYARSSSSRWQSLDVVGLDERVADARNPARRGT